MAEQGNEEPEVVATGLRARQARLRENRAHRTPPPPVHSRATLPTPIAPIAPLPTAAPAAARPTVPSQSARYEGGERIVAVGKVAPNPLNKRNTDLRPSKISRLADSIVENGQLQACTVVDRDAFLNIFDEPEYVKKIGRAEYVQVGGGSRHAAILLKELPNIKISVMNEVAESRVRFMRSTAAENLDRDDYDPIELAMVLDQMAKELRSADAVAREFGKSKGWVSQYRSLLSLAQPVQDAMRGDEDDRFPLRDARELTGLPDAAQLAALRRWQKRRAADSAGAGEGQPANVAPRQRVSPKVAAIRKLGDTPAAIASTLRAEMPPEDLKQLVEELIREA
jgi:ParB family chromosome partitioning protein